MLALLTHEVLHLHAQAVRRPAAWLQRLLELQQLLLLCRNQISCRTAQGVLIGVLRWFAARCYELVCTGAWSEALLLSCGPRAGQRCAGPVTNLCAAGGIIRTCNNNCMI